MKKALFIFTIMILFMAGCTTPSNQAPQENEVPQDTEPPPAEEPTEPPVEPTEEPTEEAEPEPVPFALTSPEFEEGQPIPVKFSCDGQNVSPQLDWTDPPEGTQSFALIMDDPDAPGGVWVHWVLYNIPAATRSLSENVPGGGTLADGSMHGNNSWLRTEYGGPCPPGGTHRNFFKLYALDIVLDAQPGLNDQQLLDLMEGHVLGEVQLMGTYTR
jgi:Raf kinase inhibitor-like YbhB/YbcL family protein